MSLKWNDILSIADFHICHHKKLVSILQELFCACACLCVSTYQTYRAIGHCYMQWQESVAQWRCKRRTLWIVEVLKRNTDVYVHSKLLVKVILFYQTRIIRFSYWFGLLKTQILCLFLQSTVASTFIDHLLGYKVGTYTIPYSNVM